MPRLPLSRLLALVLATLGLLTSGLALTPATAAPDPYIWGVVSERGGGALLDAEVQAFDGNGEVVASALSYDDPDGDHSPRPGYFALYVGGRGMFEVTFSKKGYVTETREGVKVARGHLVVPLGDVSLKRKPQETRTTGKLKDSSISTADKAKVTVTVSCDDEVCDGLVPTGKVDVMDGRKSWGSATLVEANNGKITLTLPRLDKGSYDLKVVYEGASSLKASTSRAFTLTVRKPNRKRPNARDWLA